MRVRRVWFASLLALVVTAAVNVPAALARPSVTLTGPSTAAAGQPLRFALTAHGLGHGLSAFEARVLVNGHAMSLQGAVTPIGKGIGTLGPNQTPHGLVLGFYGAHFTGSSHVLTRFAYKANHAGRMGVRVVSIVLVDNRGHRVAVSPAATSVRVGHSSRSYAAPVARVTAARTASAARADLTRDHRLDHADVAEAIYAWGAARQSGRVCGLTNAYGDVNGDGCIDVADVQAVHTMVADAVHPRLVANVDVPMTFVVNTTADTADSNPGDGICNSAQGCSLRAAIDEANRHHGLDYINFNIPGPNPHVIHVTTEFQHINDMTGGVVIDGYTQPGTSPNTSPLASNAVIGVVLQGPGPNRTGTSIPSVDGLYVESPNNVIRGMAVYNFWRDVWFAGTGASGNTFVGDWVGIGTTLATWVPAPLNLYTNGGLMIDDADHNVIGAPALADRNVISGTYGSGIYFTHPNAHDNIIQNNIVGLAPDLSRAVRNHSHGVDINFGAKNNLIGGNGLNERNILSGNKETGIELSHAYNPALSPGADISEPWSISGNQVINNYIGFMPDGSLSSFSKNVGDTRVEGGIHMEDWIVNNTIANNWITNDNGAGINLQHYDSGNIITGNHIGVAPNGAPAPQAAWGVSIRQHSPNNRIVGNEIANTPGGIWIQNGDNVGNLLSQNWMHNLTGLGIDLNRDGVTLNDAGDKDTGANHSQNYPDTLLASTTGISGTSCPNCKVELFTSDGTVGGHGPGTTYLGTVVPSGLGTFTFAVALTPGTVITATTTATNNDTSEFATNVVVPVPAGSGTIVAADSFGRSITGGWGNAVTGGPYALLGGAVNFGVNGSWGTMTLSAGGTREGSLLGLSAQNVDMMARFQTDKPAQGGNIFAYLTGRRAASGDSYRAKLRIATNGAVYLQVTKVVGGVETGIGPETLISGLTYAPGTPIWMHAQITGTAPTTVNVRAWADGQTEPAAWTVSVTDSEASLQGPGSAGLRSYLGSSSTNAPVLAQWDDWIVTLM